MLVIRKDAIQKIKGEDAVQNAIHTHCGWRQFQVGLVHFGSTVFSLHLISQKWNPLGWVLLPLVFNLNSVPASIFLKQLPFPLSIQHYTPLHCIFCRHLKENRNIRGCVLEGLKRNTKYLLDWMLKSHCPWGHSRAPPHRTNVDVFGQRSICDTLILIWESK